MKLKLKQHILFFIRMQTFPIPLQSSNSNSSFLEVKLDCCLQLRSETNKTKYKTELTQNLKEQWPNTLTVTNLHMLTHYLKHII